MQTRYATAPCLFGNVNLTRRRAETRSSVGFHQSANWPPVTPCASKRNGPQGGPVHGMANYKFEFYWLPLKTGCLAGPSRGTPLEEVSRAVRDCRVRVGGPRELAPNDSARPNGLLETFLGDLEHPRGRCLCCKTDFAGNYRLIWSRIWVWEPFFKL